MPPTTKVCINGFVLSTMLFDCTNDTTDQEGFLYGSVTRNIRDEINDASLAGTQEDILLSICSSMPFGKVLSFYDEKGKLKKDDEFNLQERKKNVIGWYRYRRYSPLYPSARETAVHKHLKHILSDNKMGPQYFVFAVLSSSNLPNFATHSFDYAFFTQRPNSTFRNLNATILNLGDTRNSYRSGSMALPFLDSPSFNSVVADTWHIENFYAIEDQIQNFHQSLRSKLEKLQEELAASDAVNACLDEDIRQVSNEMQSLLATQEQLSSASVSMVTSQSTATASESSSSDAKCKDGTGLKRAAVDSDVSTVSSKRVCLDKYFESEDQNVVMSESITDNMVTSKISSSSHTDKSSHSRLMIVDPDNGEASSVTQNEGETNIQSPDAAVMIKDVNRVPSPSSTIEVVTDAGSQNYTDTENSDLRSSSPESSVKDSSFIHGTSPNKVDSPNHASKMNTIPTDTELQNETVSSAIDSILHLVESVSDLAASTSSAVGSSSALSCEDLSKKNTSPIIIYAGQEIEDHSKDSIPSTSTDKCQEVNDEGIKEENGVASNLKEKEL